MSYSDSYDCGCHDHENEKEKNLYEVVKSQCDLRDLTEAIDQFPAIKEALEISG